MTPYELVGLCKECAKSIFGETAPSEKYAQSTAMLLAGTAVQESDGLRARRQYGFGWDTDRGGWGLFQTESAVLIDTYHFLKTRPSILKNVAKFVLQSDDLDAAKWFLYQYQDVPTMLRWIVGNDRLAVAQCRLDYFQQKGPIPSTPLAQAEYWKVGYNTRAGSGTVAQYVKNWNLYLAGYFSGVG